MQLIINQNWFRQWLGTEKTLTITWVSGDPGQWCIDESLGLIELITSPYWENISMRRKNGTVWAHEGYLHPHNWKWAIPTPQVGSGRGTGWPYFVKSPLVLSMTWSCSGPRHISNPEYSDFSFSAILLCKSGGRWFAFKPSWNSVVYWPIHWTSGGQIPQARRFIMSWGDWGASHNDNIVWQNSCAPRVVHWLVPLAH